MDLAHIEEQLRGGEYSHSKWNTVSVDDTGLMQVRKDGRFYQGWLSFGPDKLHRIARFGIAMDTSLEGIIKKLERMKHNYFTSWRKTWDEGYFCWQCEGKGEIRCVIFGKTNMCLGCSGHGILKHEPGTPGWLAELLGPRLGL